jgi:hypothetical protein
MKEGIMSFEPAVEKLPTGAIVIISGEYLPVDETGHETETHTTFFGFGETTPQLGHTAEWKLAEAFDFAA